MNFYDHLLILIFFISFFFSIHTPGFINDLYGAVGCTLSLLGGHHRERRKSD